MRCSRTPPESPATSPASAPRQPARAPFPTKSPVIRPTRTPTTPPTPIRRDLHRDTFQPAIKLWYFLDEVAQDDGPFEYVPGSHRMTRRRLRWEYRRALAAVAPGGDRGGSFRVGDSDLK